MKSDVSRVGVDVCDHAFLTGRLCRPLLKTPMFSLFPSFTTSVSPNVFKGFTGLTTKIPNTSNGVHGFTAPDPQILPRAVRASWCNVEVPVPDVWSLVFVFWYLVFAFPARYGKPQQAWARKEFFSTVSESCRRSNMSGSEAFSLQPLLRCHAYILTMVRLLARLEN